MELPSNFIKLGYRADGDDMQDSFGWKPIASQRPASYSTNSSQLVMGTMELFQHSLVRPSPLDRILTTEVECWRLAMPDQLFHNEPSRTNTQYSVQLGQDGNQLVANLVGFPTEVDIQRSGDAEFSIRGSASRPLASELGTIPPGNLYAQTNQSLPFEIQGEPATCQPGTSSEDGLLPCSSTGEDSHNRFISFQNSTAWQMTTPNVSSSDAFASFMTSNETTMVPLSICREYTPSHVQSHSSGIEQHSPGFNSNVISIQDRPRAENYEPSQGDIPLGENLSNVFVFGSSGTSIVSFNTECISPSRRLSDQDYDSPGEETDFTWSKVEALPATTLYPQTVDVGLQNLDTGLDHSIGTLSTIRLHTTPGLPEPEENPPTIDQLTIKFETNPGARIAKGKRKAFGPEEREKVKKVRENGACFSCRARKVSCTENGICSRCLRAAQQNPQLACQVCLRNKFKDIYIGVKDIHGSLLARKDQLESILTSLTGTPRQVVLWVGHGPGAARLQVEVMQSQSSPTCRWKCLRKVDTIYITSHFVEDQRYVIVPSSLPSIDRLDLFGRKILSFSKGSHSGNITPLLDAFLLHYCRPTRPSRLRTLADETLRIASLNGLVAYGFINLHDGSYDLLSRPPSKNQRYVSETIHDQIRLEAAKGFGKAEEHLFYELDNLREIIGSNEHNRIVAGICLLRLIMLYRERMVRDKVRLGLPRHGKRRNGHERRLGKAAFMYKRLTVVYSTLCGNTSPMSLDWQPESGVVGDEDQILQTALSMLRTAYKEFCDSKLTQQHDDVFKSLIAEPAMKAVDKKQKLRAGTR